MNRMLTIWIDDSTEQDRWVLEHLKEAEASTYRSWWARGRILHPLLTAVATMVATRVAIVVAKRSREVILRKTVSFSGTIEIRQKSMPVIRSCLQQILDRIVHPIRFHWKNSTIVCTIGARCVFLKLLQMGKTKTMIYRRIRKQAVHQ